MNDDRTEARMLLERAMETEPAIGMDTENVLSRARRSVRQRRAAMIGAVAAGVTVVAVASLAINPSRGATVGGMSPPPTPTATPCGTGGNGLTLMCGPPVQSPPILDETTKRLTKAFADAKVIPPGIELLPDDYVQANPMVFRKRGADDDSPLAAAWLKDAKGKVRLTVMVSNRNMNGYDVVHCRPERPAGATCTERTLTDGSIASLSKSPAAGQDEMSVTLRVVRANGSWLDVVFSNISSGPPGTPRLTRVGMPMTDDEIFKIGEITGLTL